MKIDNLRSPYQKTGGLYHFGRMLDKIRLNLAGKLSEDYTNNLGKGFDACCVDFLRISYQDVVAQVAEGLGDEEVLEWCFKNGARPPDGDVFMWNEFMRKFGWNDAASATLQRRLVESGFQNNRDIQSFFDYIDLDEGREKSKVNMSS